MQTKWLLILFAFLLILGAIMLGLGISPEAQVKPQQVEIGSQSQASFVKFTLPTNTTDYSVSISLNGTYQLTNSTMLKVANQTGSIEYFQKVTVFPTKVNLFNSSGEYLATIDPLFTTNSTVITVTANVTTSEILHPYIMLELYCIPLIWIGLLFFPAFNHYIKKELKADIKGSVFRSKSVGYDIVTFTTYLFVLSIIISVPPALYFGQPALIIALPIAVTLIGVLYYLQTASLVGKTDIKNCYNQLYSLQKIAELTKYGYYATFLVLVPIVIINYFVPMILLFPLFFVAVIFAILYSYFKVFVNAISNQGIAIINLLRFLEDFRKNSCTADFRPIKKASKILAGLVEPFNLMFAPASMTASINYHTIVRKSTLKIEKFIAIIEQSPVDYKKLLPLIREVLSEGKTLESKGLKELPTFFERYNKHIAIIVPLGTIVIAAITYLSQNGSQILHLLGLP